MPEVRGVKKLTGAVAERLAASWRLREAMRDVVAAAHPHTQAAPPPAAPFPYARPPADSRPDERPAARRPAVFVTARFRTGSTFLWQLLSAANGVTAYYEPLNERRWFLPDEAAGTDPTHRGVTSYAANYAGLGHLDRHFRRAWTEHRLVMDASSSDRPLQRYLDGLIEAAPPDRLPVLQFNRVDFRLPWLKAHWPAARLVHLYRDPRDQWASSLGHHSPPADVTLAGFAPYDGFYLRPWVRDLRLSLEPLRDLDGEHPYLAFMVLWYLSYLYGRHHADLSLAYEDVTARPVDSIAAILDLADGAPAFDRQAYAAAMPEVVPAKRDGWRRHGDEAFFAAQEIEAIARVDDWIRAAGAPRP